MQLKQLNTQVVIVGAGYSGIAAAKRLHEKNIDFIVLEARNRIGGRAFTHSLGPDLHIELGAQWIGPGQDLMYEWVREAGFHTFDTFDHEFNIYEYKGRQSFYTSAEDGPDMTPFFRFVFKAAFKPADVFAKFVWRYFPNGLSRLLDKYTVQDFFNIIKPIMGRSHYLISKGFEISSAQRGEDMSILHALFNIYTAGGLRGVIKVSEGAQQSIILEGAQNLLFNISAKFSDKIRLNQAVTGVDDRGTEVIVSTANTAISAKKIIMAIPPKQCKPIDFGGIASFADKKALFEELRLGTPIKCFAIYATPFWREKRPFYREQALSGQVITDRHPFVASYDCSPGTGPGPGVLLFFVKEKTKGEFTSLTKEIRKQLLVNQIVRLYGPEGHDIIDYKDHIWDDKVEQWSGGGYAASFPKDLWTKFGTTLRDPIGNIHWAGTEMATKWYGYMEGAIQAGYRAADEVSTAIGTAK